MTVVRQTQGAASFFSFAIRFPSLLVKNGAIFSTGCTGNPSISVSKKDMLVLVL
jgi:hypothetical protein